MGEFIKELRKEKGITQEELSRLLNVGREAISKWERGLNFPDLITLKEIANTFNITIDELIAGQKGDVQSSLENLYSDRYVLTKNTKRLKLYLILSIVILSIIAFLGYYFINLYKSIHIYTVKGYSENIDIQNGLFVKTNEKTYFNLGTINSDKEIKEVKLYYIMDQEEIIILKGDPKNMFISEENGYNEYFKQENLKDIIENLNLVIYFENEKENEKIKLELKEDYVNKNLFFKKAKSITYNESTTPKEIKNDEIISIIKRDFKKISDNEYTYEFKKDKIKYTSRFSPNVLIFTKEKDGIIGELYYDLDISLINYQQEQPNISENYSYVNNKLSCIDEKCFNEKKVLVLLNDMQEILNK